MSNVISPVVRAGNSLTARWCSRLVAQDYALSGAGVWPLLALLASAADAPARAELATALGRPADAARRDAVELLDVLSTGLSTTAAMAIWTRKDTPLHGDWSAQLPEGVVGELTDQAALDWWASEKTGGLIDTFPLDITSETKLVLASALATRVRWRVPFECYPRGGRSASDAPDRQWLSRTTHDLAAAAVLDDAVTRVVVEGEGDVDVHLLLGDRQPADVLATGLRELSGEAHVRLAGDIDSGSGAAGLTVHRVDSSDPDDRLRLRVPSFAMYTHHDLLTLPDVFGLHLVTDSQTSHLPLLSPIPLYVSAGAQDVMARFFAEGFEAAAVSAFAMRVGSALPTAEYRVTVVDVTFDRPFGFLAVHRPSRLAMVAGWVSSPFQET